MKKLVKPLALTMLFIGLALIAWLFCQTESRCPWNPDIDTVYAAGYSESTFAMSHIGMDRQTIDNVMCAPIRVWTNSPELTYWYSHDGKCQFGDFAWMARGLRFSNDIVVEVLNYTSHD